MISIKTTDGWDNQLQLSHVVHARYSERDDFVNLELTTGTKLKVSKLDWLRVLQGDGWYDASLDEEQPKPAAEPIVVHRR